MLWNDETAHGDFRLETFVRIYGATGNDPDAIRGNGYKDYYKITAPVIKRELMPESKPTVGNCISGSLSFTIKTTDTIPKSAKVIVYSSVVDSGLQEEEFGTFWINRRIYNDDLIDIEAYDAMLMGNQAYSDNSSTVSWPKTVKTVVGRIAEQMNVQLEYYTNVIMNGPFGDLNIIMKPNDEWNLLDILGYIGGIYGGNWLITDDNKLRLLGLGTCPVETNYVLDDKFDKIKTSANDYLISQGTHIQQASMLSGCDVVYVPVVTGSITTANNLTISRVTMSIDANHVYSYGNDTGFELTVENNPYATYALCIDLYNRVNGVEYAPYTMTSAVYNPRAKIGDWIIAGDRVRSIIYNETRTLGVGFKADVSAPGEDEVADEYPYVSSIQKLEYKLNTNIGDAKTELRSEIVQTQNSILASVSERYTEKEVFMATLISQTLYFIASNEQTPPSIDEPGWTTTIPTLGYGQQGMYMYTVLTYSDGYTISTEPIAGAWWWWSPDWLTQITSVKPIYYLSNSRTAPGIPTEPVTSASTAPMGWRTVIPTISDNYKYLYYGYEYTYTDHGSERTDWHFAAFNPERHDLSVIPDEYIILPVVGFMKQTTMELQQTGLEIESIEENYVNKTSVRSSFALDPTNITLSAGVDEHGNPTGRITFNAGTLIVNSTNFSLDENGILTCNGASINGEVTTVDSSNNNKAVLSNAGLSYYQNNTLRAKIGFYRNSSDICIDCNTLVLGCNDISIDIGPSDLPLAGYDGTIDGYRFIHGICVGYDP